MKIDINKKYRTRDGREAVIHSVDGLQNGEPVIASVKCTDGAWDTGTHREDGAWSEHKESGRDLIEVREPVTVFINQYPSGEFSTWKDRETADLNATVERIACHRVELPPLT